MEKDHYSMGVCRICGKSDCLKNDKCPICNAREEATDIPDILKSMFGAGQ